jgi:hypothetical protein
MPNFNTHWCVALGAISSGPDWLTTGFRLYRDLAREMRTTVEYELRRVETVKGAEAFGTTVARCAAGFRRAVANHGESAKIVAFSAYTMGACGPDFWTLPQGVGVPSVCGTLHFDLGHYNRSHLQFLRAAEQLAQLGEKSGLQAWCQQAYFMGMATHVAADLVLHELVNRSAGAYNLLVHGWRNENGALVHALWSTHNKVEHYWDSYMRARYLGDHGPVFVYEKAGGRPFDVFGGLAAGRPPDGWPSGDDPPAHLGAHDQDNWFDPHGLPVLDRLLRYVASARFAQDREATLRLERRWDPQRQAPHREVVDALIDALSTDEVRYAYERCLNLPHVAADWMVAGRVRPFVYAAVVDKQRGAYPSWVVPQAVTDEATSWRMTWGDGPSELNKVAFFSSERNAGAGGTSNNYLTYIVCPSLDQVRQYGRDVFYDLASLKTLFSTAVNQATVFLGEVADHLTSRTRLSSVGRFWNLDTGLGLRVIRGAASTPSEAVVRIELAHVLDRRSGGATQKLDAPLGNGYLGKIRRKTRWQAGALPEPAFPLAHAERPFASLAAVREPEGKLLDGIPLADEATPPAAEAKLFADPKRPYAEFFKPVAGPATEVNAADTAAQRARNEATAVPAAHRLNLELRSFISSFGADHVGMFVQAGPSVETLTYNTRYGESADVEIPKDAKKFLEGAHFIDRAEEGAPGPGGFFLRRFTSRILANLETAEALRKAAELAPDKKTPLLSIPSATYKPHYGPTFAISTARRNVLRSTAWSKNFAGASDFQVYEDLCPTEQIFLTIVPLVRTAAGVHNAFTSEAVAEKDMAQLLKIDAVGVVKLVLLLELRPDGACQLNHCLVDGEAVWVEKDDDPRPPARAG